MRISRARVSDFDDEAETGKRTPSFTYSYLEIPLEAASLARPNHLVRACPLRGFRRASHAAIAEARMRPPADFRTAQAADLST